jgi:hypothetical protein
LNGGGRAFTLVTRNACKLPRVIQFTALPDRSEWILTAPEGGWHGNAV